MEELIKDLKKIKKAIKEKSAMVIGKEAVNHFTENFDKQGFEGKKWQEVKRRNPHSSWQGFQLGANSNVPSAHPRRKGAGGKWKRRKPGSITNYSPTAEKTPILSSPRSELENSLDYKVKGNSVVIRSDKEYAKVHNEGGKIKVFGKRTATLPARPFIGPGKELDKKIKKALDKKIKF